LRFRLLPHVPGGRDGELAFSCIHCRAVLGYNKGPLDVLLWGTRLRSIVTTLALWGLLSAISLAVGVAATLGIVAVLAIALIALHTVSSRPAYKVVGPANPPG
jgi:hypothetical protein